MAAVYKHSKDYINSGDNRIQVLSSSSPYLNSSETILMPLSVEAPAVISPVADSSQRDGINQVLSGEISLYPTSSVPGSLDHYVITKNMLKLLPQPNVQQHELVQCKLHSFINKLKQNSKTTSLYRDIKFDLFWIL